MSKMASKVLKAAKATIIAGYAFSLFVPYRVEKHDGEITYHAPIGKLGYKSTTHEDGRGRKNIHTYTITTFGLLNDQLSTAKRLYTAALLKEPYYKERAARKLSTAKDKVGYAVVHATKSARRTVSNTAHMLKKAKSTVFGLEDALSKFVEDIIDGEID